MKKVGIIDYKLGNLFSVIQACNIVGMNTVMCETAEDLKNLDAYILPGVGSFREAMANLNSSGIGSALKEQIKHGKPVFGICLGLQLLFDSSEEFGSTAGLGILTGEVKKFTQNTSKIDKIRIPNIGWNSLEFPKIKKIDIQNPLNEILEKDYLYFVHSYYVQTSQNECVLSLTKYGGLKYVSSVQLNNIFATQFHPEKSGEKGLSIYRNWAKINDLI